MNRGRIILLIVLLALSAAGYWAYENMTLEEVKIPSLPKGEAATNDLYAAQRLLESLGANAQSQVGFQAPPEGDPKRGVLILPTERRALTPRQRKQLLDWAAAGGHLIVVTYTLKDEGDAADPMLDELGVTQYMRKPPKKKADEDNPFASDNEKTAKPAPKRKPARASPFAKPSDGECPAQTESGDLAPRFPAQSLRVCFDPRFRVEADDNEVWSVASRRGTHAAMIAHGAGRVTVLTDYEFMTNGHIGRADHADFLTALVGPDVKGLNVVLTPREDVDGLPLLIWRHGWTVVTVAALLIATMLWRGGTRFGPLEPRPEPVRRSVLEHVRAMGEFLWRRGEGRRLWQSSLAATRTRMARSLLPTKNPDREIAQIEARTGIPAGRLRQAFYPTPKPGAEEFARAIATLEHVRKKL